jgi:hypothetical protein
MPISVESNQTFFKEHLLILKDNLIILILGPILLILIVVFNEHINVFCSLEYHNLIPD